MVGDLAAPRNMSDALAGVGGKASTYPYDYQCMAYLKVINVVRYMPDYATMVRAGVRDRHVSGPVFLTAFANRHRYSTTEVGFRSYWRSELLTQADA